VSGGGDKFLRVWDINTGEQLASLEAHSRGIASLSVDFHPETFRGPARQYEDGKSLATIATGSSDASVKIFNLLISSSRPSEPDLVGAEDGRDLPTAAHGTLHLEGAQPCVAPCSCPPGLSRMDGYRCGRCLNKGHTELVRGISINREVVLSASYDGSARVSLAHAGPSSQQIWDRNTGRSLAELSGGHTGRIFAVVGDRTRIVTSGMDCRITIWDFGQGFDTSFIEP
jgi:WD40 repeat protein